MTRVIFLFSFPSLKRSCQSSFILAFSKRREVASTTVGCVASPEVGGTASPYSLLLTESATWTGEVRSHWKEPRGLLAPHQCVLPARLEKCWAEIQAGKGTGKHICESVNSTQRFSRNSPLVPKLLWVRFSHGRCRSLSKGTFWAWEQLLCHHFSFSLSFYSMIHCVQLVIIFTSMLSNNPMSY